MNNSIKALLLTAAGTGLMSGTATAQAITPPATSGTPTFTRDLAADPGQAAPGFAQNNTAKHACKGQNSCKGQGGCATSDMGCKTKNSCKGKGGCSTM